jgi:hypothetical protein
VVGRVVTLLAVLTALGAATPASGHYGVPRSAWLDEPTALTRLKTEVAKRYVPGAVTSIKGQCAGLAPGAMRDGRRVYKHFSCWLRIRLNTMNYSFDYRVHVVGAGGRIVLGGSL